MADQSNEMGSRVAAAIYQGRNGRGCRAWASLPAAHKDPYLADARAAIEAMRTPTEAMTAAMSEVAWGDAQSTRWAAGIDAALSHNEVKG